MKTSSLLLLFFCVADQRSVAVVEALIHRPLAVKKSVSADMCQTPNDNLIPQRIHQKEFNSKKAVAQLVLISHIMLCAMSHSGSALAATSDNGIGDVLVKLDGHDKPISSFLGQKATLIVNVASQCALTPQYEELVALDEKYRQNGFTILAFPCNQFGSQEPAPVAQIRKDMKDAYGVSFPIFDKIDVNGPGTSPLYQKLKAYENIGVSNIAKISWNFEKFLVNGEGVPVRRYKPGIVPSAIEGDVQSLIKTGTVPPRKKVALNDF